MGPVSRNDCPQRLDVDLISLIFFLWHHRLDYSDAIRLCTDLSFIFSLQFGDGFLMRLNNKVLFEYLASKFVNQSILHLYLLLQFLNFWEEFIEIWLVNIRFC